MNVGWGGGIEGQLKKWRIMSDGQASGPWRGFLQTKSSMLHRHRLTKVHVHDHVHAHGHRRAIFIHQSTSKLENQWVPSYFLQSPSSFFPSIPIIHPNFPQLPPIRSTCFTFIHSSIPSSLSLSLSMNTAHWVRDSHAQSVALCHRINLLNLLWSRQVWPQCW